MEAACVLPENMETTAESVGYACTPNEEPRARSIRVVLNCRRIFVAAAACLCISCTSWLPMPDDLKSSMSDADVKRIAAITHLSEDDVRDPKIHEVHEVNLSCWQMVKQCYPSVPVYLKVLGAVPLGCTTIYQQPWNEKVAIIYTCSLTDPITMEHERRHASGEMHKYW